MPREEIGMEPEEAERAVRSLCGSGVWRNRVGRV